MKIWEPKPPGTLWATLGLLWDYYSPIGSVDQKMWNQVTYISKFGIKYSDWR